MGFRYKKHFKQRIQNSDPVCNSICSQLSEERTGIMMRCVQSDKWASH
jgi:hypothetical protein